jgi:hypothetical protein
MEEQYCLFLQLPIELILEVLHESGNKAITSVASLNKAHLELFKRPKGLYQRLVTDLCDKNIKANTEEIIDWSREFRVVSHYYHQIRNNGLVDPRQLENLKAAYNINESINLLPREAASSLVLRQSSIPLYPLPIGDYSTAYFEVELDEAFAHADLVEDILVGASLFGSIGVPGRCRNSFGYGSDGEIALENYYYVPDGRFDPFKMETGDFVGFGINFKKNTIFFTWNCAIVLETNENMFGQKLLNLKALHAQIGIRLKAETDIDVMPFVNFGSEDFAFDILAYQRENSSTDEEPAQEILSLYSSVISNHVWSSYPDYETIAEYEKDNERVKSLFTMEAGFPSNVQTDLDKCGLAYSLYFLRSAYHELPDGERLEEELDSLTKTIKLLSLIGTLDHKFNPEYSEVMIQFYGFADVIAEEGREEFITSRYRKFAWDFCETMISLMRGHCWTLIFNAFAKNCEWSLGVLCYRVVTWKFLMEEEGRQMEPEHADAARKLLSKILGIDEPMPTQTCTEFDIEFCWYALSRRWFATKTLIQERNRFIRRKIIRKREEIRKLFGASDPILKKPWMDTLKSLSSAKKPEIEYNTPLQKITLRYFSSGYSEEETNLTEIDFGSEEELLKARVFECICKEKIYGEPTSIRSASEVEETNPDSTSEPGNDDAEHKAE